MLNYQRVTRLSFEVGLAKNLIHGRRDRLQYGAVNTQADMG